MLGYRFSSRARSLACSFACFVRLFALHTCSCSFSELPWLGLAPRAQTGIYAAMACSIVTLMVHIVLPQYAFLGRLPGTRIRMHMHRHMHMHVHMHMHMRACTNVACLESARAQRLAFFAHSNSTDGMTACMCMHAGTTTYRNVLRYPEARQVRTSAAHTRDLEALSVCCTLEGHTHARTCARVCFRTRRAPLSFTLAWPSFLRDGLMHHHALICLACSAVILSWLALLFVPCVGTPCMCAQTPGIILFRFDARLNFPNRDYFQHVLLAAIRSVGLVRSLTRSFPAIADLFPRASLAPPLFCACL